MPLKPTCREVHRLTSESLDRELTMVERARVGMHLVVCNACRNFTEQMSLLRAAMQRMVPGKENDNDPL